MARHQRIGPLADLAREAREQSRRERRLTFLGQVCGKHPDHGREKYVSTGGCIECRRAGRKVWADANWAKKRADDRLWGERNKERKRESYSVWAAANPGKMREYRRRWREDNPAKAAESCRRGQARRRFAAAREDLTAIDRARLQEFYEVSRARSFQTGVRWEVDHVVPLSKGGRHRPENLQVLLGTVNAAKSARLGVH